MRALLPILAIGSLLCPTASIAGAWTQKAGKSQVIFNGWYYATDSLYNNNGTKTSQNTYQKYELNPYLEYGLKDNITIGTNLSLQRASQDIAGGTLEHWGIGDSEFFVRFKLYEINGLAISTEPLIKLPSPSPKDELPVLGGSHPDAELGVSMGYGFTAFDRNHYVNVDVGYRYRFGTPENQLRYSATLGIDLIDRVTVMPQVFITQRTKPPSIATFTQSSGDDFDLTKLQLSVLYKYRDDISFQVGGFSHIDGKNVGAGDGAFLAVWKQF